MYIKIYNDSGYQSLKDIKFPIVAQAKPGPIFGAYVNINQFENLPGFDINLVYGDGTEDYDLYNDESFYYFTDTEYEIFKD